MRVTVNGEPHDLPESITIAELVAQLGLTERRIAVEVNRDVVARAEYATLRLCADDGVEIVHFIGGG